MDMKIAKRQFCTQHSKVKGRRDALGNTIKFLLTFSEWVDIWATSGKYEQRGKKRGQYVMSRHNDIGNYEIGNVAIKLHSDNVIGAKKGLTHSEETREKMSAAKKQLPKITCPHCNKEGGVGGMKRHHFDNCKSKGKTING